MFKVRGSQCGWNVVVKGKSETKVSGRECQGPDYEGFGKAEQGILWVKGSHSHILDRKVTESDFA